MIPNQSLNLFINWQFISKVKTVGWLPHWNQCVEVSELLSLSSSVDKKKLEVWFLSLTWSCIFWANLQLFFLHLEKKGKYIFLVSQEYYKETSISASEPWCNSIVGQELHLPPLVFIFCKLKELHGPSIYQNVRFSIQ